ncbi:hypothetical protein V3N99_04860 [Dermatophilaceae bacterium Soc4.6]
MVGQRNRTQRAQVETGAEQVLSTDADRISTLVAALQEAGSGTAEVWITDSATGDRVRSALRAAGIEVTARRDRATAEAQFDNCASAWGLEMALTPR